jgi:antitoxin (DNA-binding transcriptional repressor) of toxin-antitoxin stability system
MVMSRVNIFEVKAKLSEYIDRAARGEAIVICRHNKPVAELRALETVRTEPRPVGPLAGRPTFDVPPSFFEPMSDEELGLWDGAAPSDPLSPAWKRRRHGGASLVAEAAGTYGTPPGRRGPARRRS